MEKRKKRTATAFAAFLAFMYLCTLISKSVYAQGLPVVTVAAPQEKFVEHVVKAEGIVEAGAKRAVNVLSGVLVASVSVQAGDRVEAGELLFTLDKESLAGRLAEQEAACEKLQAQIDGLVADRQLAAEKKAREEARAREDFDALARYQDTLVGRAAEAVAQAEEELDALQQEGQGGFSGEDEAERLKRALQAAAYAEADAKWNRERTMTEAGRRVEDSRGGQAEDAALSVYRMELAALQEEKQACQDLWEQGGEIRAEAAGMVTDVCLAAGGKTPDTAALLLADETVPFQFRVSLDRENMSYVNLNDGAKLTLAGGRALDVTVDYLAESVVSPGSFTAILRLPEGVGVPGQAGSFSLAKTGEKRSGCVPLSALHEANGRNYVYALRERDGILGVESYLEELTVAVADKNGDWAALEGALSAEDLVVIHADREIKKGDVVRVAQP